MCVPEKFKDLRPLPTGAGEKTKRLKMAVFWDVAPCSLIDTDSSP
jgi:hypothetical protein